MLEDRSTNLVKSKRDKRHPVNIKCELIDLDYVKTVHPKIYAEATFCYVVVCDKFICYLLAIYMNDTVPMKQTCKILEKSACDTTEKKTKNH